MFLVVYVEFELENCFLNSCKTKSENKDLKKQKDQTPELLQLKNRLKAIEAEVKSKDEEIEDLREQVEIVQNEKEWSMFRNSGIDCVNLTPR